MGEGQSAFTLRDMNMGSYSSWLRLRLSLSSNFTVPEIEPAPEIGGSVADSMNDPGPGELPNVTAAAPSAAQALEILKSEKVTATLAKGVTKIAMSASVARSAPATRV